MPLALRSRRAGLALLGMLCTPLALAAPRVYVAYPPNDYRVAFDHVILEGSVTPGATLKIGGQSVAVASDGLFMLWWPLKVGTNDLRLVATQGGQSGVNNLRVVRTVKKVLPATPTAIDRTSVGPRDNLEYWDIARDSVAERSILISFNGSPGGRASFHVAGGPLQTMREGPAGTYSGTYLMPENSSLLNAAITVHLTGRDGRTVSAAAPGRLSSTLGSLRTGTQKMGSIRGLGLNDAENYVTTPDGQPVLYPRNGMAFTLVGRVGPDVRARLSPGNSVLISAKQLTITPGQPALAISGPLRLENSAGQTQTVLASQAFPLPAEASPLPALVAGTPAASNNPASSNNSASSETAPPVSTDSIPSTPSSAANVAAPNPYAVDVPPVEPASPELMPLPSGPATPPTPLVPTPGPSAVAPSGDLRLRIPLGAARVPFQIEQTSPSQLMLSLYGLITPPSVPVLSDPLLSRVTVTPGISSARVTLDLNLRQTWGFTANYEGNDLVLSVRRPPSLNAARPLSGRNITIDPGHGGSQKGGAGSFGIPEKNLVLPIALRVAELLRAQGAAVNLTRTADVTLGLYERGLSAEASKSDLLVSIHANALPDGRDPRGIRGPEVYFTHPQAGAVAGSILNQLRTRLPEIGPGKGLMPGANLALTRPTTQISLLVETAYLTDAGNLRALSSPEGKEKFAQAIAGGIADFYAGQVKQ